MFIFISWVKNGQTSAEHPNRRQNWYGRKFHRGKTTKQPNKRQRIKIHTHNTRAKKMGNLLPFFFQKKNGMQIKKRINALCIQKIWHLETNKTRFF